MVDQEQRALTISEVAGDWQESVVLQCKCGHPLPALTDTGPAVAASKHTTAPINHTRPSPRKHSPDITTPSEMAEPDYCLLLIYRPRKDERLSWPSWLTCSGWFTHISGHPSGAGWAQDSESSPAKYRRSTDCTTRPMVSRICSASLSNFFQLFSCPQSTASPTLKKIQYNFWLILLTNIEKTGLKITPQTCVGGKHISLPSCQYMATPQLPNVK